MAAWSKDGSEHPASLGTSELTRFLNVAAFVQPMKMSKPPPSLVVLVSLLASLSLDFLSIHANKPAFAAGVLLFSFLGNNIFSLGSSHRFFASF